MKFSIASTLVLSLCGQVCYAADPVSDSAWDKGVNDTLNETQSVNFQSLQQGVSKQAQAVVGNLQPSQIAESLHIADSPAVGALAERLSTANKKAVAATDDSMIAKAKAALPKILPNQFRGPKSPYLTTSAHGQDVITVIRAIPHASGEKRRELLEKVKQYSAAGYPEAINFVGFIFEYGLFGTPTSNSQALRLYESAAATGYQPALFNIANFLYYGKGGLQDTAGATQAIGRAYAAGQDTSGRICGLGAFMSYRKGDSKEALRYATGCTSVLAKLPLAVYSERMTAIERIHALRETLSTGVDDGFSFIRRVAATAPKIDPQLKCRYELMDRFRLTGISEAIKEAAQQCLNRAGVGDSNGRASQDIANFIDVEARAVQKARQTNQFHYSWSVPYLPFPLSETGQFLPLIEHKQ